MIVKSQQNRIELVTRPVTTDSNQSLSATDDDGDEGTTPEVQLHGRNQPEQPASAAKNLLAPARRSAYSGWSTGPVATASSSH